MKKTLWPHNIIFIIGVLFSFSHAQMPTDLTHGMLRNLIDKMEELKTDVTQMKESLANIQSESNSEMIQMRDAITSMKEETKQELRNLSVSISAVDEKTEETKQELRNLSVSLSSVQDKLISIEEKTEETNSEMIQMRDAITSMKEDAELRDDGLKKDISGMREGCESHLESLNTTLGDFINDNDLSEKLDGLNNSQKALMDKFEEMDLQINITREKAKLRDESLKEDISNLKQGCESHLESLNTTTLGDFFTHNETQIGKPQELLPADCQAVLHSGRRQSGVYKIFPVGMPDGVNVYCDQESDGGGWIVFVQRQKQTSQVDFARTFEDYAKGFGEPGQEFWLGNRILHAITGTSNYELRVDATSLPEGESRHGTWLKFSVGSEDTQFTLTVDDYDVSQSSLGDGMSREGTTTQSNQMKFSTYDKDATRRGCSSYYGRVGWWFQGCTGALPTAPSIGESRSPWGIFWGYWEKNSSSWDDTYLSWVQMKIRAQ